MLVYFPICFLLSVSCISVSTYGPRSTKLVVAFTEMLHISTLNRGLELYLLVFFY